MHKSTHRHALRLACVALAAVGYALLTACSSADNELSRFIEDTKKQPGGRVEPLPEIKPYETYVYAAADLRSPFLPSSPGSGAGLAGVRPDQKRNREFLEQYSLDTLKMVGTLRLGGSIFGLVHRGTAGNHIGQAEGKIIEISPSKISLVEIVPDSLGGYMERPAALALNE
jgi:type IV pilus assembly protein PilP